MAIKTKSAKAKGRKLQQWAADKIEKIFNLREGDVESRPMGSGGVDLYMSPKARENFPVSVECKNTSSIPTEKDLKQSKDNAYNNTLPIVVWKRKGGQYEDAWMMCRFKDFAEWYKENNNVNKEQNQNKEA